MVWKEPTLVSLRKVYGLERTIRQTIFVFLGSIVVSIPACHAGDRGSIPRLGEF